MQFNAFKHNSMVKLMEEEEKSSEELKIMERKIHQLLNNSYVTKKSSASHRVDNNVSSNLPEDVVKFQVVKCFVIIYIYTYSLIVIFKFYNKFNSLAFKLLLKLMFQILFSFNNFILNLIPYYIFNFFS